jgi:hypothetical protein
MVVATSPFTPNPCDWALGVSLSSKCLDWSFQRALGFRNYFGLDMTLPHGTFLVPPCHSKNIREKGGAPREPGPRSFAL